MNKQQINDRLTLLTQALQWASEYDTDNKILPLGWRICVSQERCSLWDQRNLINDSIPVNEVRYYQVPEHIENSIQFILNQINKRK